jgi:predicted transcriptional regulator
MLLSIKPSFALKIYDGSKNIELRRVKPSREVHRVLVYETSPVRRITGWFTIRWIRTLSPSRAWSMYRGHFGVTRRTFRAYFQDCRTAVLLAVSRVRRFVSGVKLSSLRSGIRPPQSYVYIDRKLATAIR